MKNSFKELKLDELLAKRDELKKKYFDLRFQLVVGHVENPLEKRNLRRGIARVETRISERRRNEIGEAVASIASGVVGTKTSAAKVAATKVAKTEKVAKAEKVAAVKVAGTKAVATKVAATKVAATKVAKAAK